MTIKNRNTQITNKITLLSMKDKYREFCEIEKTLPIYSKDWYLDATCGENNWDVILLESNDGKVIATMPYPIKYKLGYKLIYTPRLIQVLGPWIRPHQGKPSTKLAHEKKIMNALLKKMPDYAYFQQEWHYQYMNYLPFYWAGYKSNVRYTYVLNDLSNLEAIWANLNRKTRQEIKKAKKRFKLTVRDDLSFQDLFACIEKTFDRQNKKTSYSFEYAKRLHDACVERRCSRLMVAEDADGRHHASGYVVWDENSAYYIMAGADPKLRNSGAQSLLAWDAIQHAAQYTRKFDFEGSMIEPIEQFFRNFGAEQRPYLSVHKANFLPLKLYTALNPAFSG